MAIKPSELYPDNTAPATPDYPYGEAVDVLTPGDGTGTPWEAPLINDMFGFQQALLQYAGITPSGEPDKATASQYLTAINTITDALIINDLSQTYEFETVAAYKASPLEFPDGKQIKLKDRNSTFTKITGTGAANNFDIIASTGVSQSIVYNPGPIVHVSDVGVIGDGIVDDTSALSAALKYPNVVGHESLNVRTTAPIVITNPLQFDMAGMKLLGESTGDSNPFLYIRSSDVTIEKGQFGDGTVDYAKAIVIGDYGDAELFFRNINICDNFFLMSVLYTQQAVVSGYGRVFEVTIRDNRFQSTHTYIDSPTNSNTAVNNIAAIFMQNGTADIGLDGNQSWVIKGNRCISFPYFFNNQSVGVTSGVSITDNIVSNGMMAIRVYHIYDCIVSENIFTDCIDTMHLWQRTTYINNQIIRCGQLTPFNRPTFKVEAGTSLNIAGNQIREALGDGALIDGGNSDFTFGPNNTIYKCGGVGLFVSAPNEYPGQITGLSISNNRIVENAEDGIRIECNATIRGMTITGNHIAGNGVDNVGDVAGILFDNPSNFAINDITIAHNTIRNNDVVGGIQTAKTKWAVKFEQPSATYAEYLITNNVTHTELLVDDNRTSGSGTGTVYHNFTLDISDPQLIGMVWSRNYNRTSIQIANRRNNGSPVGVLTPLYLGEEVFDTGGQNWYKGVGASLGPWTSADWKQIT